MAWYYRLNVSCATIANFSGILINYFWKRVWLGKFFFSILKNDFAMLVFTLFFDAAKSRYEQALRKSGFNDELKYNNKDSKGQTRNKEKRKRRSEDYMV